MTLGLQAWLYADQIIHFEERVTTAILDHQELVHHVKTSLWGRAVFWANQYGYDVNGTRDDQHYRVQTDPDYRTVRLVSVEVRFTPRTQGQWGHIREQMVALHNDPVIHQDWPFVDD